MRTSLHYLRIAWTTLCGLACALLIMLWLRSYQWHDNVTIRLPTSGTMIAISNQGVLGTTRFQDKLGTGWSATRFSTPLMNDIGTQIKPGRHWQFVSNSVNTSIAIPHWFAVLVTVALAAGPWITQLPRRFSLRAALIAMTLVAATLGIAVYLTR